MAIAEAVAGAVQGLGNVGIGIWNAFQQHKNYAYQKNLQKQIFAREDNALQRRVADAEKAGYNKFAVLGDGAGAGSVVSTTAPQVDDNLGSRFADAMQHTYQLAIERNSALTARYQAEQARHENNISQVAEKVTAWKGALNIAQMMKDAGYMPAFNVGKDLIPMIGRNKYVEGGPEDGAWNPSGMREFDETPLGQYWRNDYNTSLAHAQTLKTDAEWRKTNYIVNTISKILGGVSNTSNAISSWRKKY